MKICIPKSFYHIRHDLLNAMLLTKTARPFVSEKQRIDGPAVEVGSDAAAFCNAPQKLVPVHQLAVDLQKFCPLAGLAFRYIAQHIFGHRRHQECELQVQCHDILGLCIHQVLQLTSLRCERVDCHAKLGGLSQDTDGLYSQHACILEAQFMLKVCNFTILLPQCH